MAAHFTPLHGSSCSLPSDLPSRGARIPSVLLSSRSAIFTEVAPMAFQSGRGSHPFERSIYAAAVVTGTMLLFSILQRLAQQKHRLRCHQCRRDRPLMLWGALLLHRHQAIPRKHFSNCTYSQTLEDVGNPPDFLRLATRQDEDIAARHDDDQVLDIDQRHAGAVRMHEATGSAQRYDIASHRVA